MSRISGIMNIKAGGAAQAAIAIGDAASGEIAIDINNPVPPSVIRDIILEKFPVNAENCSQAGRSRLPFAAAFLHTLVYISNRLI